MWRAGGEKLDDTTSGVALHTSANICESVFFLFKKPLSIFDQIKDNLNVNLSPNGKFELTGFNCPKDTAPTGFDNIT